MQLLAWKQICTSSLLILVPNVNNMTKSFFLVSPNNDLFHKPNKKINLGCTRRNVSSVMGENLFVFKLPIMHIFSINSSQLVLYISILYYSNRGILPDVNACLFTVERQNKRLRIQLSVMISWLSALCCEGTLTEGWKMMPYFTLWISGDSKNWYLRGFLLQCSRRDLMPFTCVTLFCEDVQDCKCQLIYSPMSAQTNHWCFRTSFVCLFFLSSPLWCEMGWWSSDLFFCLMAGFVICAMHNWNITLSCVLTSKNASDHCSHRFIYHHQTVLLFRTVRFC